MSKQSKTPTISSDSTIVRWLKQSFSFVSNITQSYGIPAYSVIRFVGWFVVTTGMITLVPLMLEIKREAMIEEMESLKVSSAIESGATPQELANAGMTSAIDPKVLKG